MADHYLAAGALALGLRELSLHRRKDAVYHGTRSACMAFPDGDTRTLPRTTSAFGMHLSSAVISGT